MTNLCKGIGSTLLLVSTAGTATIPIPASAQEPPPSIAAPTDTPVIKHGRMDVRNPLRVGSDYYPKESLKHHEQGRCTLAFFTEADGSVPAAQLLKSTGFPRLDTACFESVLGVPVIPATINGTPVAGWSDFNVVWVIDHAQPYYPLPEGSAFPRVVDDYELHIGKKFYPGSDLSHPKGYCVVRVVVGTTGSVRDARITHSTGSTVVDRACLSAIKPARFTPELQNGMPVEDSTDIAIYW